MTNTSKMEGCDLILDTEKKKKKKNESLTISEVCTVFCARCRKGVIKKHLRKAPATVWCEMTFSFMTPSHSHFKQTVRKIPQLCFTHARPMKQWKGQSRLKGSECMRVQMCIHA